jgi:hypothetical protein
MNEQLLKLYRQAQVPGVAIDPTNNMHYETTHFSADKFAELIVQECINVLHDNELWSRDVSHVLNEHFGVK